MKHYGMPPVATKSKKLFLASRSKSRSQGDLGVIWKGVISGVCMPNMKSISYRSKVIAKVKVDNRQTNRQTDKQTDRQDKNKISSVEKQNRSTEWCSKLKCPERRQVQERLVSKLEQMQSQMSKGPGVRRSKRPLLACRARCKCSMETSCN